MTNNFDENFSRFMWGTDLVLLAASTPHIAAWYAHFDNSSNIWAVGYAWIVGFGLAIAIDGISLMLLYALTRMIRRGDKSYGSTAGILAFMGLISGLSWFINWQYDVQFATETFQKADAMNFNLYFISVKIGEINPIIGGAFSILMMAYALIAKVIKEDDKPVMSDDEYQQEVLRLNRERALNDLRKSGNQGILNRGKESLLGKSRDANDLLDKTLSFLRDADDMILSENQETALQALSALLKIRSKDVLPLLIQARSIIRKEEQERIKSDERSDDEQMDNVSTEDDKQMDNVSTEDDTADDSNDDNEPLNGLHGRDTVSLEAASKIIGCQTKYVATLRNQGKLKHGARREDMITVASLRSYLASRKRRNSGTSADTGQVHHTDELETLNLDKLAIVLSALKENPNVTDEEIALLLHMKRPAAARFWRVKAQAIMSTKEDVNA